MTERVAFTSGAATLVGYLYNGKPDASRVRAPVLVCVGKRDKETQEADARRLAKLAPRGELQAYDLAHFDFYRDDVRQRVIADQIAFLRRVLSA